MLLEVQFRFEDLTANVTLRGLDVARAVTERRVPFEVALIFRHISTDVTLEGLSVTNIMNSS